MGFTLLACDQELEGLDNDENFVRIDITVDPSLGNYNTYKDDDSHEEIIKT